MSRALKVVEGLATLLPLAYLPVFALYVLPSVGDPERPVEVLIVLQGGAIVITGALLAYYVQHVIRSGRIVANGKVGWVLALFLAAPIALPIYFLLHRR